jgi:hypothetical protein
MWKDTVMSKEQRDEVRYSGNRSPKELCEAQAEITWEIAFQRGKEEAYQNSQQWLRQEVEKALKVGEQEGIRKALDIVEDRLAICKVSSPQTFPVEESEVSNRGGAIELRIVRNKLQELKKELGL